jgi:hypothetical protein
MGILRVCVQLVQVNVGQIEGKKIEAYFSRLSLLYFEECR